MMDHLGAIQALQLKLSAWEEQRRRSERTQVALNEVQVKTGIGIASGVMIGGYAGTQHRATYICVGNTVNLAACIDVRIKVAGCPILVDENTCNDSPDGIRGDSLGPVLFKGE